MSNPESVITPKSILRELYKSNSGVGYLVGYYKPLMAVDCGHDVQRMVFFIQIDREIRCHCVDGLDGDVNQLRSAITNFRKEGLVHLGNDDSIHLTDAGRHRAQKLIEAHREQCSPLRN